MHSKRPRRSSTSLIMTGRVSFIMYWLALRQSVGVPMWRHVQLASCNPWSSHTSSHIQNDGNPLLGYAHEAADPDITSSKGEGGTGRVEKDEEGKDESHSKERNTRHDGIEDPPFADVDRSTAAKGGDGKHGGDADKAKEQDEEDDDAGACQRYPLGMFGTIGAVQFGATDRGQDEGDQKCDPGQVEISGRDLQQTLLHDHSVLRYGLLDPSEHADHGEKEGTEAETVEDGGRDEEAVGMLGVGRDFLGITDQTDESQESQEDPSQLTVEAVPDNDDD